MLSFRQALIACDVSRNTAKVQQSDIPPAGRERIKALLRIDLAKNKVDRNALRAACGGISPQAVSNWISSGTISKENLDVVASFTKRPVEQYLREQPEKPSQQPLINEIATGWYASKLKPPSDTRSLIDQLGDALDCCGPESRTAVAGLLHQYALSPKPGAIADAIVMFLERCKNPNADNPFPTVTPPKSTTKPTKRKTP